MKQNAKAILSTLIFALLISSILVSAQDEEPVILVGHLTYHTGPFAEVGPPFDAVTDFTIELINQNPPLNRQLEVVHEDIGTIGEARAARKLIEFDGVDVLLNPAHNYGLYREWIRGYIGLNNRPIMPSVHGGAIDRTIGGVADEPLFRGSPMDTAQSAAAILQAQENGAEDIVIIATTLEGHQLQKEVAISAAGRIGINVLSVIEIETELGTYQQALSDIPELNPDAVIVFAPAFDGGTIVNNLAALDAASTILGPSEWGIPEFLDVATEDAIAFHEAVWVVANANADSTAWTTYESLWNESEYTSLAAASNSYNLQYYDLLIVTALAIEAAGTTDADAVSEQFFAVANSPGRVVYTYDEGIAALRSGEDIDYSGVTGEMSYNDTGVVSGLFGIYEWDASGELVQVRLLDDQQVLELDSPDE
jgi:ABC-type branched-subunit amino acid transport system substrate-binding protein